MRSYNLLRSTSYFILSALPLVATWLFYHIFAQASLFEVVPYPHFDPFDYFLQINGFAAHGFSMGHFSQNEVVPFIATSPFGVHGPVYVSIVGLLAGAFGGLGVQSAPIFNFTLLTASILTFYFLVRPKPVAALYSIALILVYPEMMHFTATYWQEPANMGLAYVLAALFHCMLLNPGNKRYTASLFVMLILASLIRPTWGFLLPGYFVAISDFRRLSIIRGLFTGIGCHVATFFCYQFFASPWVGHYAPWQLVLMDLGTKNALDVLLQFSALLGDNFLAIWRLVSQDRFLFLVAGFLPVIMGVLEYRRRRATSPDERLLYLKLLWVFGGYAALICATSLSQSLQTRHLYPVFLFSCLLLACLGLMPGVRMFLLGAQVAALGFGFQLLQERAYDMTQNSAGRLERIEWFSSFTKDILRYEPTNNAWCNSLLVTDFATSTEFLGLQPGFGLSYILHPAQFSWKAKSRFLLIKLDQAAELLRQKNSLRYLASTTAGDIYVNLDCNCPERVDPDEPNGSPQKDLEPVILASIVSGNRNVRLSEVLRNPIVTGMSLLPKRTAADERIITARVNLEPRLFLNLQHSGSTTDDKATVAPLNSYDSISLDFVFIEKSKGISLVVKSIRIHCDSGRFMNYVLTNSDLENIVDGKPISSTMWTHNDRRIPICQEP
ncbi:hypothetical protein [Fundidesulfovibrio soli]|uniref:hypothetical protein n=1 Tax=Fundidesulfovibrio soli TaxID=2922716 RepID=UPI001FAF01EF|nr:hypothetical protein [Fundidesulfovibrio soli]